MRGCLKRTVQNRADEIPGEPGLLSKVHRVYDFWGIGINGPRRLLRVGHGSDV